MRKKFKNTIFENAKLIILKEFDLKCSKLYKNILNVPQDELVRFFNAFFRHRKSVSRIYAVLNDFAYGFNPVRNRYWLNNKLDQLIKQLNLKDQELTETSKKEFVSFINN